MYFNETESGLKVTWHLLASNLKIDSNVGRGIITSLEVLDGIMITRPKATFKATPDWLSSQNNCLIIMMI